MAEPMPDWTVDEILAVHFRMHKAEGVLFPVSTGRVRATHPDGVFHTPYSSTTGIPEKQLAEQAERVLEFFIHATCS
jgi:hypothetical protein